MEWAPPGRKGEDSSILRDVLSFRQGEVSAERKVEEDILFAGKPSSVGIATFSERPACGGGGSTLGGKAGGVSRMASSVKQGTEREEENVAEEPNISLSGSTTPPACSIIFGVPGTLLSSFKRTTEVLSAVGSSFLACMASTGREVSSMECRSVKKLGAKPLTSSSPPASELESTSVEEESVGASETRRCVGLSEERGAFFTASA